MIILGIDPGSQITGYGVVAQNGGSLEHIDSGLIRPPAKLDFVNRLGQIYEGLMKVFEKFDPDEIAIEQIFFAQNVRSALRLGEARGVALLAARHRSIPLAEYSALQVKQAVTGFGHAGKDQIQRMVQRLLKLPEVAATDASDALAIAICHAHSRKMNKYTSNQAQRAVEGEAPSGLAGGGGDASPYKK